MDSIIQKIKILFGALSVYIGGLISPMADDLPINKISLPDGFKIEIYAEDVPGARSMALNKHETLFVGTRDEKVYAVVDKNKDKKADKVYVIADGLNMPNGVALKGEDLYVAEVSRILVFKNIQSNLNKKNKFEVIRKDFPKETHHGWKFIKFSPEGSLHVPVGAPCNVCKRNNPIFSSITKLSKNFKEREIIAHGVRNTVGFDWHPKTKKLYFTDNGRDWMGNDSPPDELNRLDKEGENFGFPYCHGTTDDPKFDKYPCSNFKPPFQKLGPHVAALGMEFYDKESFPKKYHNQIFIAEHGSWNRDTKIGYRITNVFLENNKAKKYVPFATGWLQKDGEVWGRPVDIELMPDGSMLVSDDYSGTIYRITYTK